MFRRSKPSANWASGLLVGLLLGAILALPVTGLAHTLPSSWLEDKLGDGWDVRAIPEGSPEEQGRWVQQQLAGLGRVDAYLVIAPAAEDDEDDEDRGGNDGDHGSGPSQPPQEPQPPNPPAQPETPKASVTVRTILPGTAFATKLYVIDSGRPGPTVWISGGVHGSELAGWKAAERIAQWRVTRGRLLVLPHANALGVKQQRREPSGYGDLNRQFPTTGDPTPDSQLAQAIWDELRRYRPDWVIDLHEALGNRNLDSGSVGQTIIAWPSSGMVNMARTIIGRINQQLPSHLDFQLLRYPVQGSLARAAGQVLGANAAIIETSRKYDLNQRIQWHLRLVEYLLDELNMAPSTARATGVAEPARAV